MEESASSISKYLALKKAVHKYITSLDPEDPAWDNIYLNHMVLRSSERVSHRVASFVENQG